MELKSTRKYVIFKDTFFFKSKNTNTKINSADTNHAFKLNLQSMFHGYREEIYP